MEEARGGRESGGGTRMEEKEWRRRVGTTRGGQEREGGSRQVIRENERGKCVKCHHQTPAGGDFCFGLATHGGFN